MLELTEADVKKGVPQVGEILRARDIWPNSNQPSSRYIWSKCIDCGKERWSYLRNGKPDNSRCRSCSAKEMASHRDISGENNPAWKGGIVEHPQGYICVCMPEHPSAYSNGYVPRSRLVLEKKLGRFLIDGTVPHHINGNKKDDRPDNLEELLADVHLRNHANRSRDERGRFKATIE